MMFPFTPNTIMTTPSIIKMAAASDNRFDFLMKNCFKVYNRW